MTFHYWIDVAADYGRIVRHISSSINVSVTMLIVARMLCRRRRRPMTICVSCCVLIARMN